MSYFQARPISLVVQLAHLSRQYPDGQGALRKSRLFWNMEILPHVLAHRYKCRLEYSLNAYPDFYCLEPALTELAAGRPLPHVYSRDEPTSMCLFRRDYECWNDSMLLAKVVVPLAFYWLANFEEWLFSGEWRGGGTHAIKPSPPAAPPTFASDIIFHETTSYMEV